MGYAFGTYSPIIKRSLHYNQRQINALGVAKDIGDSVGLVAGSLCDVLPPWGLVLFGAVQNLLGYGWLWLIVTGKTQPLSFWAICVVMCIGTNGETYFNTAALVSCVRIFPRNRGPVLGILKAFAGLSGAIFTQIYVAFFAPDQASFIFIVAIGPALVALAVMSIIGPMKTLYAEDGSETRKFNIIQSVCLALAAYLMGVMLIQDLGSISDKLSIVFAAGLLFLLLFPLVTAFTSPAGKPVKKKAAATTAWSGEVEEDMLKAPLLDGEQQISETQATEERGSSNADRLKTEGTQIELESSMPEMMLSWSESEEEIVLIPEPVRKRMLPRWLVLAIAKGAVRVKKRARGRGPHRGEDFTLRQAMQKADFWLLFFSLYCGAGSGLTVMDNLGQMSQAHGYESAHIFVCLISIWNFLGRLAGGYTSEIFARWHTIPRPIVLVFAQLAMASGMISMGIGRARSMYVGCVLVGLGYGVHWSIVPATTSELFGMKNFGILYNFLVLATPAASMVLSGVIAGTLYDREADMHGVCIGVKCFFTTCIVLACMCLLSAILSSILVVRTKRVYGSLYHIPSSTT